MRKYLFLSCLFCMIQMALAQTGGTLKGRLTDENNNNEPVAFADVAIYKNARVEGVLPELVDGTSTDENGEYYIPNVPAGTYMIEVTYVGMRTILVYNVLLKSNGITPLDIKYPKEDEPNSNAPYRLNAGSQGKFYISAKIVRR